VRRRACERECEQATSRQRYADYAPSAHEAAFVEAAFRSDGRSIAVYPRAAVASLHHRAPRLARTECRLAHGEQR
jgi:hypothetical protein